MRSLSRILCLAFVLCGCAAPPTKESAHDLQAYSWRLASALDAAGQPAQGWSLPGHPPLELNFSPGRLTVANLCNVVSSGYRADNGQLEVTQPISTMRACPDAALMALEQRVAARLPQVHRYEFRSSPGAAAPTLALAFDDGSRWELAGAPTAATRFGSAGERVFMEVAPTEVPCDPAGARCLYVRDVHFDEQGLKQSVGEWRTFHGQIEGFTFEPGMRTVLRLQRYPVASGYAYVLDMVVESESVR